MKYKIGTLEKYLIDNPERIEESDPAQKRKRKNPKKDNEYLWESEEGDIEENKKFNLVAAWTGSIAGHTSTKYYISKNGDTYYAGLVEIGSCMSTGSKDLEIFDNKNEWQKRAQKLNTEIEEI